MRPRQRRRNSIQQLDAGYSVKELWEVIAGKCIGRSSDQTITLFDSVGFDIEDVSALRYVRSKLEQTGLYVDLDLLADPNEPRDLYGILLRCEAGFKAA